MAQRTCERDGCEGVYLARGMCRSCYSKWRRATQGRNRQSEYYDRTCITCDAEFKSSRKTGKFCSDECKGVFYSDALRKRCKLPAHHPVILQIAANREADRLARAVAKRSKYEWRTARECPGCACSFTPLHTPNAVTCSKRCQRRVQRWRRAARERGARGEFTWSEFMRIARKFDYCCAYCGVKPERLDPDHVVPLSRGGSNTPSNLLPACNMCNSNKCAMLLDEWAAWIAERGLPARRTSWEMGDPRYTHLTDAILAAA